MLYNPQIFLILMKELKQTFSFDCSSWWLMLDDWNTRTAFIVCRPPGFCAESDAEIFDVFTMTGRPWHCDALDVLCPSFSKRHHKVIHVRLLWEFNQFVLAETCINGGNGVSARMGPCWHVAGDRPLPSFLSLCIKHPHCIFIKVYIFWHVLGKICVTCNII